MLYRGAAFHEVVSQMSDSQKPTEEAPPHLQQKELTEFLESLQRIFKIGTYYPAGHSVLDQAVHLFQHNLQKISVAKRSASIESQGEIMLVEGRELVVLSSAVRELQKLFRDLGIGRVEIDRTISLADLQQFARTLLLGRSQLHSVKQFTPAKIVDIPSSMRLVQKEFLVDEASIFIESRSDEEGQNIESIFQLLADQGLDRGQITRCRDFLNSLTKRFTSRPMSLRGLPAVSWHDVCDLLVKVVSTACHPGDQSGKTFAHNDLNALSAIFNGLRQELVDQESRDTINLLVTVFNRGHLANQSVVAGADDKKKGLRATDNATDMTIFELQEYVRINSSDARIIEKIKQVVRHDELALLLQLLQYRQDAEVAEGIRRAIRNILATSLSPREVDVLIKGVLALTQCQETELFSEGAAFLALQMRNTKNYSPMPFLVMLCNQLQPAFKIRIWPTVVNEMLATGRQVEQQRLFAELASVAAELPVDAIREQLQELEKMDALMERKIAVDIFDPEAKSAYPLYAVLLKTSMRMPIASRVLSSLGAAPQDWLIEAVAPLLQLGKQEHMNFLYAYLTVAGQNILPVRLRVMAGNLVIEQLPELGEAERNEDWVLKTIAGTGQMQVEGTRELLERIIVEKKMVVVPKWPASCRRAAALTLKNLKRKPLG